MSADEDNFDIDLYGDQGADTGEEGKNDEYKGDEVDFTLDESHTEQQPDAIKSEPQEQPQLPQAPHPTSASQTQSISSTVQPSTPQVQAPKQAPQQQGVKRKDSSSDHRPLDPGSTSALLLSDLQWWNTEDDLRGWANQADAEDELKDVTFSEHKVNGKSKGQAFLEFKSPQAATATKRKIDSFASGQQNVRKCTVSFTNPSINPFKTLPKDGPMRAKEQQNQRSGPGGYNAANASTGGYSNSGGFRGRGGGFNNRGNSGGGFNNRNFSGPMGSYQQPQMGGFQNNMGGMPSFGGFNNRGGMMNNMRGGGVGGGGMRGGRGGMNPGMMPMGNMANMGMGGMGMPMGGNMNPMMNMGMQGGFQGGNANFNPGFFQNQAVGGVGNDGSWNPHGAKRTRQE